MKILAVKLLSSAAVLALAASCSIDTTSPSDEEGFYEDEEVGNISSPLRKGTPGAVIGQVDYCNGAQLCTAGEGDCDTNAHCAGGLICATNVGPQFGMPANRDLCLPAHCTDRRLTGDETQVDCGGSCGAICAAPACASLPVGHQSKCVIDSCVCTQGQGDCDSSEACATGLACVANNGPKFGMPVGHDACAPAHCGNRVLDGNETAVDCGGSCGTAGPCAGAVVVPGAACPSLTSITYRWLATCAASSPLVFGINGSTALSASSAGGAFCSCDPGIREQVITDPDVLGLVLPGNNSFVVQSPPQLAFSWAKAILTFANGATVSTVLEDIGGGSADVEDPNVCDSSYAYAPNSPAQTVAASSANCN